MVQAASARDAYITRDALQRYDNVVGRWAKKIDGSKSLKSLTNEKSEKSEKKVKRSGELGYYPHACHESAVGIEKLIRFYARITRFVMSEAVFDQ